MILMPKTYLFLDCDGVLHGVDWRRQPVMDTKATIPVSRVDRPLSRLPTFEAAILPYLDRLTIVVSSDWRLFPEYYDRLLTAMSPDVRACVIGGTPRDLHGGRPIEISAWLSQHGEPGSQVIVVDDDLDQPWDLLPMGSTFIGTDYTVGFSDLDAAVLSKLLADGVGEVNRVRKIVTTEEKRAVVEGRAAGTTIYEWPEPES